MAADAQRVATALSSPHEEEEEENENGVDGHFDDGFEGGRGLGLLLLWNLPVKDFMVEIESSLDTIYL